MKKILIAFILFAPVYSLAQKEYNVTGLSKAFLGMPGIGKTKMKVIVGDSTYTTIYDNKSTVFQIIKKVDSSYFKITDGLKDYIIKISDQKVKKYSGMIIEDTDMGKLVLYYE